MADWGTGTVRGIASSIAALAAGLLAGQVTGDPMEAGVAALALAGILYSSVTFWWWNGFRFPGTLSYKIRRDHSTPGTQWVVEITFKNPGREGTFDLKYIAVEGVKIAGATPGSYLKWRGQPIKQDAKRIPRDGDTKLSLCEWPPGYSHSAATREHGVVTHSSTGSEVHVLRDQGGGSYGPLIYRVLARCDETGKQAHYEIAVSGPGARHPDVSVRRLDR